MASSYRSHASGPPFDGDDYPVPPTPPPPYVPYNPPLTYLNQVHQPHDLGECVHTTCLCEQGFARLEALLVNLERCQCRCRQSTWRRLTKSFFGSLREHTASLRSRGTRSKGPSRSESKPPPESPYKNHPSMRTGYPTTPPTDEPTELENSSFMAELNGSSSGGRFNQVPGQRTIHPPSLSYPQELEYSPAPYELPDSSPSNDPRMVFGRGQTQAPSFYERVAPVPGTNSHSMAHYSHAPTTPRATPSHATSMMSQLGSDIFPTPHSSILSGVSSLGANGTPVSASGASVYATETTSSPFEYESESAPWNTSQPTPPHPTAYTAELPGNTPISELGTYSRVAEMDGAVSFMSPPSVSSPQPIQRRELPAHPNMEPAFHSWDYSQPMVGIHPTMIPNTSYEQSYQPQSRASHPGSQPFVAQSRQHSYNSGTAGSPNFSTPNGYVSAAPTPEHLNTRPTHPAFQLFPRQPTNPTITSPQAHNNPAPPPPPTPRRQRGPATAQRNGRQLQRLQLQHQPHHQPQQDHQHQLHRQPPQEQPQPQPQPHPHPRPQSPQPEHCPACNFTPRGPGQRHKMARHKLTDKHRINMGQPPVPRFPCTQCHAKFGRLDNLRSHVRVKHPGR